jgi:hypothetical protein
MIRLGLSGFSYKTTRSNEIRQGSCLFDFSALEQLLAFYSHCSLEAPHYSSHAYALVLATHKMLWQNRKIYSSNWAYRNEPDKHPLFKFYKAPNASDESASYSYTQSPEPDLPGSEGSSFSNSLPLNRLIIIHLSGCYWIEMHSISGAYI